MVAQVSTNFGLGNWLASLHFGFLPQLPMAQFNMGSGEDGVFGPATAVLKPDWVKLGYYGIFFGFGAICFPLKGFHQKLAVFGPYTSSLQQLRLY